MPRAYDKRGEKARRYEALYRHRSQGRGERLRDDFPDAPGCFSAADASNDIFAMAREALDFWAEGVREDGGDIGELRDFEALRADPKWRESFTDAAFVIAMSPS